VGGAERESRARKQVSGLAPEGSWGHGRYPKEAGLQRTAASALWAMRVVCAPKGERNYGSEDQEGCWGWRSTLSSSAKSP